MLLPKIFYQWVFAVFTCVFYAYTHVIWSTGWVKITSTINYKSYVNVFINNFQKIPI